MDIITAFVAPTGKLEYQQLRQHIRATGMRCAELQQALRHPVLVGRQLFEGQFLADTQAPPDPVVQAQFEDIQTIRFKLDLSGTAKTANQRLIPNIAEEITPEHNIYALRMQPAAENPAVLQASIGKLSDNDVIIDDMSVSRRHGHILLQNEVYFVCDAGSTNGTKVSFRDASPGSMHQLLPNARVSFGRMVFVFTPLRLLYNMLVDSAEPYCGADAGAGDAGCGQTTI